MPEHDRPDNGQDFVAGDNEYANLGHNEVVNPAAAERQAGPDAYIGTRRGFQSQGSIAGEHPYAGHEGTFVVTPNDDPFKQIITVISPDGASIAAPDTPYTRQTLADGGYRPGDGFTGLDPENMRDPDAWAYASAANFYADAADRSTIKEYYREFNGGDMGGRFMNVDNIPLETGHDTEAEYTRTHYDPDTVRERVKAVGKFATNNGHIAAVDGTGLQHEAPYTEARRQALLDAGYQEGPVSVKLGTRQIKEGTPAAAEWRRIREADDLRRSA